jgi:hypothetical protein
MAQGGEGRIMAQLFILSYSDAVSFRDIRGHLGTIPSIVSFHMCACRKQYFSHIQDEKSLQAKNKKEGTLGWVNMGNDLTQEHVFLSLPTTSWSYFYSPGY